MSALTSLFSVVIPSYGRGEILVATVRLLLKQQPMPGQIIVLDQTPLHRDEIRGTLAHWHAGGVIRWIYQDVPGVVTAMNRGLLEADGKIVLFLDDDIVPGANLVQRHADAYARDPEIWAVVGQVLQPEDAGQGAGADRRAVRRGLCRDLEFGFNGTEPGWVENVMAGNLSVKRERALAVGGFDENFIPPISYRFETEFAKRLIRAGGKIWFEPSASIRHLRTPSGGTRSLGSHLTSASPLHGVGDYYYALRCGKSWERFWYMARRPFREVRTRFHLRHPWYIPVKFVGELRAWWLARKLASSPPRLIGCRADTTLSRWAPTCYVVAHKEDVGHLERALLSEGFNVVVVRTSYTEEQLKWSPTRRCLLTHRAAWCRAVELGAPWVVVEADFVPCQGFGQVRVPLTVSPGQPRLLYLYACGPALYRVVNRRWAEGDAGGCVALAGDPSVARLLLDMTVDELECPDMTRYSLWDSRISATLRRKHHVRTLVPVRNAGEHGGIPNPEHGQWGLRTTHRADSLMADLHFLPAYAQGAMLRFWRTRVVYTLYGVGRLVAGRLVSRHDGFRSWKEFMCFIWTRYLSLGKACLCVGRKPSE